MYFLKLFTVCVLLIINSNNVFSAGSSSDSNNTKTKSLAYLSAEKLINKKQFSYVRLDRDLTDLKIKNFNEFKNIDLFKPNSKEISSALDIKNPTVKNLEVIGKKFMKKNLIDNLMITLSEKGILIITKQSVSKFEIYYVYL